MKRKKRYVGMDAGTGVSMLSGPGQDCCSLCGRDMGGAENFK
jgi:hypothetical protein